MNLPTCKVLFVLCTYLYVCLCKFIRCAVSRISLIDRQVHAYLSKNNRDCIICAFSGLSRLCIHRVYMRVIFWSFLVLRFFFFIRHIYKI